MPAPVKRSEKLHPEVRVLLEMMDAQNAPPIETEDPVAVRAARSEPMKALGGAPEQIGRVEDLAIPGPVGDIPARLYAEAAGSVRPALVYFHGGGFVIGNLETHDPVCRSLAKASGAVVISIDYRLAPEHRFPAAVDDCYAATRWVAANASGLGIDPARIAVGGDSAGGNLATAACLLAKERGGPNIRAQALIYPATDCTFDTPSFHQFGDGYYLTAETSRWFWHQYAPDRSIDKEATACPLNATLEQLKDLPPALIITAECDILRDEGEAYARKLMQAGVSATCTRYLGAIHGFMGANALAETPACRAATEQVNATLKAALATTGATRSAWSS